MHYRCIVATIRIFVYLYSYKNEYFEYEYLLSHTSIILQNLHLKAHCACCFCYETVTSYVVHYTQTHTTILWLSDFVQDNPGEPVPEETFTHSHLSVVPYLLHPFITIYGILPVQFTCLTVFFHNFSPSFLCLPLSLAPSTSYSIHFFTQSLSSFCSTCPYHRNLLCCSKEIMSSNPSLSTLYLEFYLVASCHTSI